MRVVQENGVIQRGSLKPRNFITGKKGEHPSLESKIEPRSKDALQ
jgi:hypothetical protein